MSVLYAILVMFSMAGVDYCHGRYTQAMMRGAYSSALWSVGQWTCVSISFVIAVKVSVWYLPFEGVGLALGTLLAVRRMREHLGQTSS